MMLVAAVVALAVALSASVCSAKAHPSMHATPVEHSRPDTSENSHEECVLMAARVSDPTDGHRVLPILAIFNVSDLPLMGTASRLTHSFEFLREPLDLFSPTHERAPPISLRS